MSDQPRQSDNALPATESDHRLISGDVLVGGQAVIEGVMMRTPNAYAVAVRRLDGSIAREGRAAERLSERYPALRRPLLRGVAVLVQSLVLGVRALNYSASVAAEAEGESQGGAPGLSRTALALTLAFSALVGIGLFVVAPLFLAGVLRNQVAFFENWLAFNFADGVLRLLIFIAYIGAMLLSADIRRVFAYHGAEHKVVFNWESGRPLAVPEAAGFSRLHPRCGTSFLLIVMSISIVVFALVKSSSFVVLAGSRLILMPLIAGLSYELLRWSSRQKENSLLFYAIKPGLALQRMTTREPDEGQLEVAIVALQTALQIERERGAGAGEAAA